MPDIKICVVCEKIFDFDIEGFTEEVEGVCLFVCSEVCAVKNTFSRGKDCFIVVGKPQDEVSKPTRYKIHNLN